MVRRTWVLAIACGLLAGCGSRPAESGAPVRTFEMEGEVLRVDSKNRTASIRHGEIAGWMEAMTMDFPVRDEAEFRKLQPGKRIRAAVKVQDLDYWLENIRLQN
jgi:protein SCO1/2